MDGGKELRNDTAEYLIKCRLLLNEKYGVRSLLSWRVSWLSILALRQKKSLNTDGNNSFLHLCKNMEE